MSYSWLPSVLAEIAEVAGLDAALKMAEARGGTEIYIPAAVGDDHWLTKTVGREAAERICEHFTGSGPGCRLELPLGPAGSAAKIRAKVDRLIAQGKSEREIALATGYSGRGVRLRRANAREREKQGRLL
ncbi:MAG: helix-turn-helix domain-containing protein [Pseudomonadota bacterium]|nr:helix-turn-helix domain-containing protein [Pseudomonadota bacterium]